LRDHKFNQLSETEQWMLVRMWLLASESDNHMAYDEKWVRRAINSSRKVPLEKFVSMGFLEIVSERVASTVLASRERSAAPEAEERREERTSIATPVDNSREEQLSETLAYMDSIDFHGRPRLEALNLGATLMDEAIRRTRSRGDVDNQAAYFTTVTRNLLAVQRAWKSEQPLEERLETYVRNAGWEYTESVLEEELSRKGADAFMIGRLLVKADEIRKEAA
jgi:hypothetical protein